MPENIVNIDTAVKLGLSSEEFEDIQKILGRNPGYTEVFAFSLIWGNHDSSSYKVSRIHNLEMKARQILNDSGISNSGTIEIGDGLSCFLKIESNYHTLPGESYNESASCTIKAYRDMLVMNANLIAGINSFHFGKLNLDNTKNCLTEFINGSSTYSNVFGTPIVGVQAYFNECKMGRSVLSSLLLGIKNKSDISSTPLKAGDKLFIIKQEQENNINSPIYEKLLHENISEGLKSGLIKRVKPVDNDKIFNFCLELFTDFSLGIHVNLDQLATDYALKYIHRALEFNLNSSILLVVSPENENILITTLNDSNLSFAEFGELIEKEHLIYSFNSKIVADIPFKSLKNKVHAGQEFILEQTHKNAIEDFDITQIPLQKNLREIAWFLIKHPNIVSKKWIFEQYDSMVGVSNMTTNFPSSASLVNLKESNSAIALSMESSSRYFKANPEIGIQIAVAEAARRIACTGAKPVAIASNFNFLNPENPAEIRSFLSALKGLARAGKKFKTPVHSEKINILDGNLKENNTASNCFLPVIGMMGILEDKNHHMTISFKNKGNIIFLIGQSKEDISSSEYLYSYHEIKESPPPSFNLDMEYKVQTVVHELIKKNYVCSVHAISKGGLFISLVESAMRFGLGFDIITDADIRTDAFLFGETQGRILVSITPNKEDHFIDFMLKKEIPYLALGHVTKGEMRIDDISFGFIDDAKREYDNTLEKIINV